uniref:Uncharacterized protein n=1 Tax=Syphacia muris TaxID=451379 RepID=A0A0N5AYF4_9BILA
MMDKSNVNSSKTMVKTTMRATEAEAEATTTASKLVAGIVDADSEKDEARNLKKRNGTAVSRSTAKLWMRHRTDGGCGVATGQWPAASGSRYARSVGAEAALFSSSLNLEVSEACLGICDCGF